MKQWIGILLLSVLLSACAQGEVPEYSTLAPVNVHTTMQVKHAIRAGMAAEKWEAVSEQPGLMVVEKREDKFMARVNITYGYAGYGISYNDSQNMFYDERYNSIAALYGEWVAPLDRAIQRAMV